MAGENLLEKSTLGRLRRWEDNNEMYFKGDRLYRWKMIKLVQDQS
jgi:hypothetical protein